MTVRLDIIIMILSKVDKSFSFSSGNFLIDPLQDVFDQYLGNPSNLRMKATMEGKFEDELKENITTKAFLG